jgi:hypothetical protein
MVPSDMTRVLETQPDLFSCHFNVQFAVLCVNACSIVGIQSCTANGTNDHHGRLCGCASLPGTLTITYSHGYFLIVAVIFERVCG